MIEVIHQGRHVQTRHDFETWIIYIIGAQVKREWLSHLVEACMFSAGRISSC